MSFPAFTSAGILAPISLALPPKTCPRAVSAVRGSFGGES